MHLQRTNISLLLTVMSLFLVSCKSWGYEREDYEEDAGASFSFLMNYEDDIYAVCVGSGTWLRNTPIFGDYFVRYVANALEDAAYSGVGMTMRIMPHWTLAPFIGAGGSYNYRLSVFSAVQDEFSEQSSKGNSYWGGHVECGFRLWMDNKVRLFELLVRQTWSSNGRDHDYWLVGFATGTGF
ncbi:MAG: hypothetical protein JXN60_07595 [Lentisphaerae bacterium]|nr:hypothetical protein [Lentisphaerota bacterium]